LGLDGHSLTVRDSFTPDNQRELNAKDLDIGSGGPMLTPNGLVLAGGKNGDLYVLDRQHMARPRQIFEFQDGIYAAPAYWNGHIYVLASGDCLSDFALKGGELSAKPVATGGSDSAIPARPRRSRPMERLTASCG
jgi:hypothetical protein